MNGAYDVAIVGGGIVGVSAAAFLAEEGQRVVVFERAEIGAGASGRNSGTIQHPFDAPMAALHGATLPLYRDLADGSDYRLPTVPNGLLLLSDDADAVRASAAAVNQQAPGLAPTVLAPDELARLEPALANDLWACRLETGYAVAPAWATNAFAARARRAGATIEVGARAQPAVRQGRLSGVVVESRREVRAERVLVAAGPWTPNLIVSWSELPPIQALWGVVATIQLENAPYAVLEELGIDRPGGHADELFSLVTAAGATSVGSTFLAAPPDTQPTARRVLTRAARFVPAIATSRWTATRTCARPVSFDGRPLIGAVPEVVGLFVCAGHGAWGISTGPASARLVVDAMLGRADVPQALSAARWSSASGSTNGD